jgi:hypothetical protein
MGSKARKDEPSLDDPRWRQLLDEYKLVSPHRGHPRLAYTDLKKALADGRVRSMRRPIWSGEPERLPPEFWANRDLAAELPEFVTLLTPNRRGPLIQSGDFVYFLWHPDVEKAWLAPRQVDDEMAPVGSRPGPKPTGDWYTLIAQWLIEVAADDPKRLRNVDVLVVEATAFLQAEIGWAPAEAKDLRKKIIELLQRVHR